MNKSRNDIDVEINNEMRLIISDVRSKAKDIIEMADELSQYITYYNTLKGLNSNEDETLFKCDITRDLLEDIAYKMEKIK